MGYNLIVFFFLLFLSLANAGLNFYISQQESFRVLGKMLHQMNTNFLFINFNTLAGLVAELAYVRDGSINDVAQHFVVPVPSHIQELCFVWVNADSKAVCFPANL